jgi:DNA gyrase inhibitor GyrI
MRHVGPYHGVFRRWQDFTMRLMKDGLPSKDSLFIGVPMDNPKVTPSEKLRYDTHVTVDEKYLPPEASARADNRGRRLCGGEELSHRCHRQRL